MDELRSVLAELQELSEGFTDVGSLDAALQRVAQALDDISDPDDAAAAAEAALRGPCSLFSVARATAQRGKWPHDIMAAEWWRKRAAAAAPQVITCICSK